MRLASAVTDQPKRNDPEHRRMRPDFIRQQDSGADRVRDDQERHIGWRVIRTMTTEIFATYLAGVDDLEIGAKQAAPSAGRTPPHETAHHRFVQRAVGRGRRNAPNAGHVVHRRLPL